MPGSHVHDISAAGPLTLSAPTRSHAPVSSSLICRDEVVGPNDLDRMPRLRGCAGGRAGAIWTMPGVTPRHLPQALGRGGRRAARVAGLALPGMQPGTDVAAIARIVFTGRDRVRDVICTHRRAWPRRAVRETLFAGRARRF